MSGKIYFQKCIRRNDLRINPSVFYVFGDNVSRTGYGGQASQMRDEPNAIGIRTKFSPTMRSDAFFSDNYYDLCTMCIKEDIEKIENRLLNGNDVVFPSEGIGTGRAELSIRAPMVFTYLQDSLEALFSKYKAPDILTNTGVINV